MKNYAEKKGFCLNHEKCWYPASHYKMEHLLLLCCYFIYIWVLFAQKYVQFVEHTPKKSFNSFVQSAVDARRQGDENPNTSVVAETMQLLANSFYGYQIMDRSRHNVMKNLADEKTHAPINRKLFKKLDHVNNAIYEVEQAKAQIEHKGPIVVVLISSIPKTGFCDVNKYEELEMHKDSRYLVFA